MMCEQCLHDEVCAYKEYYLNHKDLIKLDDNINTDIIQIAVSCKKYKPIKLSLGIRQDVFSYR